MKKKEIVLIVALVVFGVIYHAIEKGRVRFAENFANYTTERRLKGSRFSEFPGGEKQFPAVSRIVIENPAGEVTISRSTDGLVHLAWVVRVYYSDRNDVDALHKKTEVRTDLADGTLNISAHHAEAFPYQHLRILLRLQVPVDVSLAIANQEGDVTVRDTGKEMHLDQENGNLVLENIPSDVDLRLKNCIAKIKGLAGHAEIKASRSNIFLEQAVSLRLNGRHGEMFIKNVEKDAHVEQDYGSLTLADIGRLEISARHCRIHASRIKDGAAIANKYQGIFLENAGGDIRLSSRLSKIELRGAACRNAVIENAYADVTITDFSGANLDILLNKGDLELQAKDVTERINIKAQHAELNLVFAALTDPTFNIKTRHGRIYAQSSLGLEAFEENDESFANRAGQKPEILIQNIYGNIRVKTQD